MSYDLMVFDPAAAPATPAEFMAWYEAQAEWEEDHDYEDPTVSTPALRAWFIAMQPHFPAMNGPFAPKDDPEDDALLSDYCVGRVVIYVAFAWSKAEEAYPIMKQLALQHAVGFFDASGSPGQVWLPDGQGGLAVAFSVS